MDILWFRLARDPEEGRDGDLPLYCGRGYYLGVTDRFEYWQVACVIPKGHYPTLRAAGLGAFRQAIVEAAPRFADQVGALTDWAQVPHLSVESGRLTRWYRPGLLLIGDAAHPMSAAGGFGITCAIQDAVVAAGVLAEPIRAGRLGLDDLAAVQRAREWPTRTVQALQALFQRLFVARALDASRPFTVPLLLRLRALRPLVSRLGAFGISGVSAKARLEAWRIKAGS